VKLASEIIYEAPTKNKTLSSKNHYIFYTVGVSHETDFAIFYQKINN
jgi:hypothetical protein